MKQYQPSFLSDQDGKTSRHPCLNDVLASVCNSGFNGDLMKPNSNNCKWDEDEEWWLQTMLDSTSAQALTGSPHKVPLLKLSHTEHTFPIGAGQESFSIQHSCNKVQPYHVQTNSSTLRDKDILKNEVEKLTNAVSCAQACLERIQPIPPPRNVTTTATNPFVAQGVFQNRAYPVAAEGTLKPNSQGEPLITRGALRSSHAPTTGAMELFWGSPVKAADKQLVTRIDTHSPGIRASKKEALRPLAAQAAFNIKPPVKDTEGKDDLSNLGEHLHVQKHERRGGQVSTTTSYMKDAATEITPTASHRDIGTQMTPVGSSRHPSPHRSPQKERAMSPTRQNIPMRTPAPVPKGIIDMRRIAPLKVERSHQATIYSVGTSFDSNWSSREEEEEEIGKGFRHLDLEDLKRDVLDARATAWKEATKLKLLAKYEREETKIQAWEELQAAKAAADLKKLEMKLERKRIQTRAKIANRLHAAHRKAEERRVAAKSYKREALEMTCHRADEMLEESSLFQAKYSLCACFSQSIG
ncbi:hypothetical protein L7F22_023654 [Adiantum nelumboides]|nr:hypothetical protein [Adiantum nelumboides]